jgi:putative iron-regulated protein
MKKTLSFLLLGTALTFAACGKDKKAANDPAPAAAPADPAAKPADPNAAAAPAAPAGGDQAKPEEKKAGGW